MGKNIYHIIYEGVEALDFTGPHDVFAMANYISRESLHSDDLPFQQYVIASAKGPVKTAGGIAITPDFTFDDAIPEADIIFIPGGPHIKNIGATDPMIKWIQSNYSDKNQIVSVCLGAFPLVVALGQKLQGHTITTHHQAIEDLREKVNSLNIDAFVAKGQRYVSERNVLCSAGVSSGIDAAFYLLSDIMGQEIARQTSEIMEYNRTINWSLEQ